jgi:hypothetical protein
LRRGRIAKELFVADDVTNTLLFSEGALKLRCDASFERIAGQTDDVGLRWRRSRPPRKTTSKHVA